MNILINRLMKALINFDTINADSIVLEPSLASILSLGIVKLDDLYLLKAQLSENFDPISAVDRYFDKTELECSINHIHIGDIVKDESVILQGIKYAKELAKITEELGEFEVILSCSIRNSEDCSVRFHKIRPDEAPFLLNLEDYEEEALFVIR